MLSLLVFAAWPAAAQPASLPVPPAISTGAVQVSSVTAALAVASSPTAAAPVAASSTAPKGPIINGEADILSIGGYRFTLSMPLIVPFERLLRDATQQVQILNVDNVSTFFKGNTYRYRLPDPRGGPARDDLSTATVKVPVLESEFGFFLLSPPDPELMGSFLAAAKRPDSYRQLMEPELRERFGELGGAQGPEGVVYSLKIESPRAAAKQWRKGLAVAYRLWLKGRPVDAVFIYKTQGGIGRLATALETLRKEGRPAILVSRGTLLARDTALMEGRARLEALGDLGLQVSDVGLDEFRIWEELEAYRKDRPAGTHFLSANLVWASSPAVTALPPSEIISTGSLRVAFISLTRPSFKRFMTAGKLKGMTLTDPIPAAQQQVRLLRPRADILVVLSNLEREDNARLSDEVRGIDLILADEETSLPDAQNPRRLEVFDPRRDPYDPCLLLASEYTTAVDQLTLQTGPKDGGSERWLRLRQNHTVLDESIPDQQGFPDFENAAFGVDTDTQPAVLPSATQLYPQGNPGAAGGIPALSARHFWTLAASLMATRTRSEAALLPLLGIAVRTKGEISEAMVRDWFYWNDSLVSFELSGKDLLELLAEVRDQQRREKEDLPPGGKLKMAAGGIGAGDTIHGVAIDPGLNYRVTGTELLLGNAEAYPALGRAKNPVKLGDLRSAILAELRAAAGLNWTPQRYRDLMGGAPVSETAFWKVNFRDISINATNTNVVRDQAAFAQVPNSRIQGFNQQVIGTTAKIDVDYLYREYKWSNSFNLDYSRSRLHPPGQPVITNLPTNNLSLLTAGTKRVGVFPYAWLAKAYGPSLGFQYDGEVERGLAPHRKNIFSLYPGVQLFNGTVVQSVDLSANLKRDISRDPPNNQYGLRGRVVVSTPLRKGAMTLQGETWVNYFVLTQTDTASDLRLEGDVNAKLQIPLYHRFTLAPFLDFYYFQLKIQRLTGYSAITGLSLGFSRLWKPQYEKF